MKEIDFESHIMDSDKPSLQNGVSVDHKVPKLDSPEALKKASNPNVLYHFIDGFVIEEADTPFTMDTGSLLTKQQLQDIWRKQQELIAKEHEEDRKIVKKSATVNHVSESMLNSVHKCEYCGKVGKGHRSPRFCTLLCCRRYNIALARKFRIKASKLADVQDGDTIESPVRKRKISHFSTPPLSPVIPDIPHVKDESGKTVALSPDKWTVENVCDYISSLPDSKCFAKDFRSQEIDGSALLLIKEDHLISSLNIKLGPALKLCSHINKLQE